jgi:hypothetical protein
MALVRYLLLLCFAAVSAAQPLQFMVLKEGVLEERLRLAHPKNAERYARLKKLFEETGCRGDNYHEQAVKGSKQPNLICDVSGTRTAESAEEPRKIIVGAHFDAMGGSGVIDNWSGAVLLPSLSEFLRTSPHRHKAGWRQ